MPLSDVAIRKAKATDKAQRLFDGFGLYLEVTPAGSKLWRQKYRFAGKEKRLAHGSYPTVTLAEARERREEARKLLSKGLDPAEHRRASRAAAEDRAGNSFEVIAREWLGRQAWVPHYRVKVEAWFTNDIFPWIGGRPVAEITAPLLVPVMIQMGVDPIHFGMVMIVNIMIGGVTPPFGSMMFTTCSITKIPIAEFVRESIPFIIALIVALLIVTYWPWLIMLLPNLT